MLYPPRIPGHHQLFPTVHATRVITYPPQARIAHPTWRLYSCPLVLASLHVWPMRATTQVGLSDCPLITSRRSVAMSPHPCTQVGMSGVRLNQDPTSPVGAHPHTGIRKSQMPDDVPTQTSVRVLGHHRLGELYRYATIRHALLSLFRCGGVSRAKLAHEVESRSSWVQLEHHSVYSVLHNRTST